MSLFNRKKRSGLLNSAVPLLQEKASPIVRRLGHAVVKLMTLLGSRLSKNQKMVFSTLACLLVASYAMSLLVTVLSRPAPQTKIPPWPKHSMAVPRVADTAANRRPPQLSTDTQALIHK